MSPATAGRHRAFLESLGERATRQEVLAQGARRWATPTCRGWPSSTCRSPSAGDTAIPAVPGTASTSRCGTSGEQERIAYQGNWRDIFQNWEALSLSCPSSSRASLHDS